MKRVFRGVGLATAFVIIALLGLLAYIRLAPSDASWHVSPLVVTAAVRTHEWLVAPGGDAPPAAFDLPADDVARILSTIVMATPRTERLAGAGLHTTWITRSAIMGYPDYTSIMVVPTSTGSDVLIYARSRFGVSDFGVNRARVERWLGQLRLQATQP